MKTDFYQLAMLEAYRGFLLNTEEFFFRKVCRWYSKNFQIPLSDVMAGKIIPIEEVFRHYYEEQLESNEYNQVLEALYDVIPNLSKEKEKEDQAYAEDLEELQKQSIIKAELKGKKQASEIIKKEDKPHPTPPKMNLTFDEDI